MRPRGVDRSSAADDQRDRLAVAIPLHAAVGRAGCRGCRRRCGSWCSRAGHPGGADTGDVRQVGVAAEGCEPGRGAVGVDPADDHRLGRRRRRWPRWPARRRRSRPAPRSGLAQGMGQQPTRGRESKGTSSSVWGARAYVAGPTLTPPHRTCPPAARRYRSWPASGLVAGERPAHRRGHVGPQLGRLEDLHVVAPGQDPEPDLDRSGDRRAPRQRAVRLALRPAGSECQVASWTRARDGRAEAQDDVRSGAGRR